MMKKCRRCRWICRFVRSSFIISDHMHFLKLSQKLMQRADWDKTKFCCQTFSWKFQIIHKLCAAWNFDRVLIADLTVLSIALYLQFIESRDPFHVQHLLQRCIVLNTTLNRSCHWKHKQYYRRIIKLTTQQFIIAGRYGFHEKNRRMKMLQRNKVAKFWIDWVQRIQLRLRISKSMKNSLIDPPASH